MSEGAPGPTQEGDRIAVLDAIRGVALFGILPVNLVSFALPLQGGQTKPYFVAPGPGEAISTFALQWLFTFKFISLFSLLFGVGISLQRERARARGAALGGRYVWRNIILLGIGFAHGVLLWYGDILFYYAALGILLFGLAKLPKRTLAGFGLLGISIPIALAGLMGLMLLTSPDQPQPGPKIPDTLAEALADPGAQSSALQDLHPGRETLIYREGTYLEALQLRFVTWMLFLFFMAYYVWRLGGLFLLGMAAYQHGLFRAPEQHRQLLNVLIGLGAFVGLPLEAAQAALPLFAPDLSPATRALLEATHHVTSLLMMLGILAAILRLPPSWSTRGVLKPFAAAGRMSLTHYLSHTVLGVALFYSLGCGLFGTVTRVQLWGLWVAIVLAQLVISSLWLRLFRFGPVEWAWRSLTWLELQPLLRHGATGARPAPL